jgi:zinc and cadmium transporter
MNLLWIMTFCLLGSVLSVGLAGVILLFPGKKFSRLTSLLIPYAIGTLLGAAFFGMIPHALRHLSSETVLPTLLAGLVLFFLLEKFTLWRHCHEPACEVHHAAGELILIGDSLHNFVDGVAIAVAFSGSVPLGIATSLAVIAHEVPQEVGDFAVLLESGFSRSRAFWFNLFSSAAALLGALLTYFLLPFVRGAVPYLLTLSAASFIYIALADLIPGRRTTVGGMAGLVREVFLMGLGIGTIALLQRALHG